MEQGPLYFVEVDEAQLEAIRRRVAGIPYALQRIVPKALNRAITAKRDPASTYNLALRRVGEALGVPAQKLKRRLFTRNASGKNWSASLRFGSVRFRLGPDIEAVDVRPRGVLLRRLFGATQRLPQAFMAPGLGPGVYIRRPVGGGKVFWRDAREPQALVPRRPLLTVRGVSETDVYGERPQLKHELETDGSRRIERALWAATEEEIVKRMPT